MILGCCIDLSWYDTLVKEGYQSIAPAAKDVVSWDDATFEKISALLTAGPLQRISLNSFCTPDLRLTGKGYDPAKLRAYMERLCPRAEALGFRYIGIGAPASRNLDADDDKTACLDTFKDALRLMCEAASSHGLEILLESVCSLECNFITTTTEALAIVKELCIGNLHLVYDIYHEMMEHQSPDVIDSCIDEIRVVHIAQDEGGKRAYPDAAHADRYKPYWDKLSALGYRGEWNNECFTGDPAKMLGESIGVFQNYNRNPPEGNHYGLKSGQ